MEEIPNYARQELSLLKAELPSTTNVTGRDLELWCNALDQLENELYYAYNKRVGRKKRIKFIHGSVVDLLQRVREAASAYYR